MMTTKSISRDGLASLVADLVGGGTEVIAPSRAPDGEVEYRRVLRFDEIVWSDEMPRSSLKEFFLPPSEPLFSWRQTRSDVTIEPVPTRFGPRVVLGARPCDVAGVAAVDAVMGWDYRDELWFGRREATTLVSSACGGVDGSCFCRMVGLSPESEKGADLVLFPGDGGHLAKAVTEKGESFLSAHAARFGETTDEAKPVADANAGLGGGVAPADPAAIRAWLSEHFEDPMWESIALRCHGCGACAAVCPSCHCFDIVDEPEGLLEGTRRRNWDTCQTARFTVHASGHNPRADQSARFRQRVMHKFSIYPAKFGEVLCTGCGRCARACPAGMDLPEIVSKIAALAAEAVR